MVDMQVGDRDGIHPVREAVRHWPRPSVQVHHGARQHRVGEDPGTVLDKHSGVPEPPDLDRHFCSMAALLVGATPRRG